MNLRFDRFQVGDIVRAKPAPGRPVGNGTIIDIERISSTAAYVVTFPDGRQQSFFDWQLFKVEPEELRQAG